MGRPAGPDDTGPRKPVAAAAACAVARLAPACPATHRKEQRRRVGYISGLSSAWQPAFISYSDRSPDVINPVMVLARMRTLMARRRDHPTVSIGEGNSERKARSPSPSPGLSSHKHSSVLEPTGPWNPLGKLCRALGFEELVNKGPSSFQKWTRAVSMIEEAKFYL